MKIALLVKRLKRTKGVRCDLVHTGQHYDLEMSAVFFRDLGIPRPDIYLGVGSGTHAEQTAKIMTSFESVLRKVVPDLVIVVGDVNSTLACSVTAAKLNISVAHIESGLRSFDRTMPEEINRIVTDAVSSLHFVSEKSGMDNLLREGADNRSMHLVGSIMIDPLVAKSTTIDRSKVMHRVGVDPKTYGVLTLHRPSNVDSSDSLSEVFEVLSSVAAKLPLVYPIHPRARQSMKANGLYRDFAEMKGLRMIEPVGYIDFIKLVKGSRFVLTDSGSVQEETTFLNVPCLTMRDNTERPSTVEIGTNKLVGRDKKSILTAVDCILNGRWRRGRAPKYWDGRATERILKVILKD